MPPEPVHTTDLKVGFSESDPPRLVSGAKAGFRIYLFGDTWGADGKARYLRPRHMSFGVLTMGPLDQPLSRAWGKGYRGRHLVRGVF